MEKHVLEVWQIARTQSGGSKSKLQVVKARMERLAIFDCVLKESAAKQLNKEMT